MTLRVLIADDHPLFRDGITSLLQAAGLEVVGQAGNGREAIAAAHRLQPDLVLMDIEMPDMNGIEATRTIKAELPDVDVVILTVSGDDQDLFAALQAGARGYLLKSMTSAEFLRTLQGLAQGEAPLSRGLTTRLIEGIGKQALTRGQAENTLSEREVEVLGWVARGHSNKGIAHELGVSENTVKYHLKNIMQKLQVHNRAEAVAYAAQHNLLPPD